MARLSFKNVCKGTALLFFVIVLGLNAQTHTGITSLPVTLSISSNESLTSPQTLPTTAPATTSSPSTESQTSTPTTAPATTSSPSTESQTSTPTTPATTSSPSTESQTSAPTTVPATTSSLSTEFQTSAPTTAPASTSSPSTESQTSAPTTAPATSSSPSTEISAPTILATTSSPSTKSQTTALRLNVIKNLTVTEISTSFVLLKWDTPLEMVTSFEVQWSNDKTSGNCIETSNTFYNITGLTAGVNYTFCITAVAADNSTGETFCICICIKFDACNRSQSTWDRVYVYHGVASPLLFKTV
ncbi:integumentary mucin A.1-like isoform X3 [Onychostoma macrolepis]|uniref:integumentary mucin A.1-like isoform X3 n=1 Tax=Onychostoma macrolepis TaxID=369639 RepID=UPI00272D015A|nr:integumentary mucin A.1-like isoform X3 [Onychostoma macrolepis]